jgi:hypothetical protein
LPRSCSTTKSVNPVHSFGHKFHRSGVSDGFGGMGVGLLRFVLALEYQCDPSVITCFDMKAKAVWNHLDRINLNGHEFGTKEGPPPVDGAR